MHKPPPEPDAETRRLLAALPGVVAATPVAAGTTPAELNKLYARAIFTAFAGPAPPEEACAAQDLTLPSRGGPLPARLYRPASAGGDGGGAGALFIHGGGWSHGDVEGYDVFVRDLAVESGAVLLSVDYRLTPDHPFPAGLDDVEDAFDWLAAHAGGLGLDPRRLAVVGDSAGGALAAVTARERADRVAFQVLIYPMTDVSAAHDAYPSRGALGGGGLLLAREHIDLSAQAYLAGGADARDPRVSPLLAPELRGAPPAFVLTAELDPLRDEGRAYAERLREAGVPVDHLDLEGAIHAALSFGDLAVGRRGRTAVARALRAGLGGGSTRPTSGSTP